MSNKSIYLDYNSTTPVDKRVLEKMLPWFTTHFGNAASKTHSFGWIADEAVLNARKQIASVINASAEEIIFTSGATESLNLALKGVYNNYREKGNHLIVLQTEHKAVLDTCNYLETLGARITYLSVNKEGLIDLEMLEKSITRETILISAIYANNETGTIQPIAEIGVIAKKNNIIFLSDATQALGKIQVDVMHDQIDLLAFSAHKLYGPKGIGALYIRRRDPRVQLIPVIHGGGHERGLRSGTLNVPLIVGMGEALTLAEEGMWDDNIRISALRTQLEQALLMVQHAHTNGSIKHRTPNVTNLYFEGVKSEQLIKSLPNIAFSAGSACTSAIAEPSHVLKAMQLPDKEAFSSVRFSLGRFTTQEEITYAIDEIKKAVMKLRAA